ncbi:ABC transporter substrate-binding protein [Reticulibacter mediterranei]|nr:sugar ABC transporter substrate-binding protein [Reticulibacter mediterranei]
MRPLFRALVLLLLTLAPAALASCGSSTTASGETELSFWIRSSGSSYTKPLVDAYNKTHKAKIKLTLIPDANFVQKFGTAVAGGNAPDIVAVDLIYLPAFSQSNQMTDITDMAHQLSFFDQLSPSHVRLATFNNRIYGLPYSAEGSILLYNKTLFKQAGLDPEKPPTNWAEIEAYAKKITALGNNTYGYYFSGRCAGCNAFTFLPLIWASGGDVLSDDGKTPKMDSPAVKDAFSFYKKLWDEQLVPKGAKVDNGSEGLNAFTTGKIGMVGSGAFSIGSLKKEHPNIDFGVSYLPGKDGGTSSFAGGDSIGIPRGSKHSAEAFDFIKWCLSDDVQIEQFAKNGSIPVRTDLATNKYSQLDPRYVVTSKAMAQGHTPYSVHYNQLFNDANGPWIGAIQHAVFDGKVDEALNTAQGHFTQILAEK